MNPDALRRQAYVFGTLVNSKSRFRGPPDDAVFRPSGRPQGRSTMSTTPPHQEQRDSEARRDSAMKGSEVTFRPLGRAARCKHAARALDICLDPGGHVDRFHDVAERDTLPTCPRGNKLCRSGAAHARSLVSPGMQIWLVDAEGTCRPRVGATRCATVTAKSSPATSCPAFPLRSRMRWCPRTPDHGGQ